MRFGKGGSLSSAEGALERCEYSIRSDGDHVRLVIKCKECEGKSSLLERGCRNKVIDILLEEPIPDSIILSGFVETLYEDGAVALVQRMTDLLRTIQGFRRRTTGGDSEKCSKCKNAPAFVFRKIERAFRKGLPAFRREMKIQFSGASIPRDSCKSCMKSTKSDLRFLSDEMSELKSFILRCAFRISIAGE
jgi:hypothetical protein